MLSCLTNSEWAFVAPFVAPALVAWQRKCSERALVDTLQYVLPNALPRWETVRHPLRHWSGQCVFGTLSYGLLPKMRPEVA